MEHVLRLERAVLDATDVLAVRGIRCVALKGVALANGVYAHPADRTFVDADLLIDPTRYVDAIDALLASGARRDLPEVRAGLDARFAKDVPVVLDGTTLDLHRTLIRGPLGERIPVPALIAWSETIVLVDARSGCWSRATRMCSPPTSPGRRERGGPFWRPAPCPAGSSPRARLVTTGP